MYTEAIYEYFNGTSSNEPKRKKTGLARCNAFKRKTRKSTVVLQKNPTVPKTANVPSRSTNNPGDARNDGETSKNSTENQPPVPSQQLAETTPRTTAGAIYETVLSIWKYTKSFISYNSSDVGSRNQNQLRQDVKNRTNYCSISNFLDSSSLAKAAFYKITNEKQTQTSSSDICVVVGQEEHHPDSDRNGKGDGSTDNVYQKDVGKIWTTKEHQKNAETQTSIAIPDNDNIWMIHKSDLFFQKDQQSICVELDDSEEKLQQNFSINSDEFVIEESNVDDGSTKVPTSDDTLFSVSKEDIQDKEQPSTSAVGPVNEAKKLKSSLKTYGRGKRRSQKLHVSFKEDYMVNSQKLPTYRSCSLNMNHSYFSGEKQSLNDSKTDTEPNKNTPLDKKESSFNFGGKKRRLTLLTNSSRSSIRKKRQKRCSSNISLVTKPSASKIVCCNKHRRSLKKSSARSASKYLKYKNKKAVKDKNLKNIQKVLEVISDIDNSNEPVHLSYEDCYQIMKAIDTDESDCDELFSNDDSINPVYKQSIAALGKLCEESIAADEISVESKIDLEEHEIAKDEPSSRIPEELFEKTVLKTMSLKKRKC